MKRAFALVILVAMPVAAQIDRGHRLPDGEEHRVREREIDIEDIRADLTFDMERETIAGVLSVRFTPLRAGLTALTLDQADLAIERVELAGEAVDLEFAVESRTLRVELPEAMDPGESATVAIRYSCHPTSGMYFFRRSAERAPQAWNYGEGGRHATWLPLYNDTNDRFTATFDVTVARPYTVVSNGVLEDVDDHPDGTRTFHWRQSEPIPNYLLTVDVGDFARVPIGDVSVAGRTVPLAAWTPPGTEDAAAHTFAETPAMVEFFSRRFNSPYPWDKYDQIVLREFGGAMETTTATGFSEPHLHRPGDPPDGGPYLELAYPIWTYTDTVSHELAHHWFGDLVTCRSLETLWLNESFASFCHTLWTEHADGGDDLTFQRWRYLDAYLGYVRREGLVRPLEFSRYDSPEAMYQEETTYLKGALVLQMLRHVLGDEDFFRAVSGYLQAHELGSVDSNDLQRALEDATGRNLSWFFADWIHGGGHPVFEVSTYWAAERRQLDLSIEQVQSDLPFENDFRLPVDIGIMTASGTRQHTVEVSGWSTHVALPCEEKPLAVVFDAGGWLVAEVRSDRPLEEVLHQLVHGDLAARLRAARALAESFPRRDETVPALARVLADSAAYWGLRQEAALDLGTAGGTAAVEALGRAATDPDRRIRRAVAVALGRTGGVESAELLRLLISRDPAEDVVGAAEVSLGTLRAPGAAAFLTAQLERDSRWWDVIRVGALQGLAQLEDPALVPTFRRFLGDGYNEDLRIAAIDGWTAAAPEDPLLSPRLRELVFDRNSRVRGAALEKLGSLHRADDLEFLVQLAAAEPDPDLARAAVDAAQEIKVFVSP